MKYVNLGRSGLKVSRLCLGCMSYGEPERLPQPWSLDEKASRPLIRQALEAGINLNGAGANAPDRKIIAPPGSVPLLATINNSRCPGRIARLVDLRLRPLSRSGSTICPIGSPLRLKTMTRPWPEMATYTLPSLSTRAPSGAGPVN